VIQTQAYRINTHLLHALHLATEITGLVRQRLDAVDLEQRLVLQ